MIHTQALAAIALAFVQNGATPTSSPNSGGPPNPTAPPNSATTPTKDDGWQELDRVMMIVNEEIITRRTMGRDYFLLKREHPPANDEQDQRLQNEILTSNVKEKLRVQAGQDMGLDEAQVDRQVRDQIERETEAYSGVVGLSRILEKHDVDSNEHRRDIRDHIYGKIWDDYITGQGPAPSARVSTDRYIRPGQMRFEYNICLEHPETLDLIGGKPQTVELQQILIDAQMFGGPAKSRELALQIRRRILDGEDMSQLNDQYSADKKDHGKQEPLDEASLRRGSSLASFLEGAKPGDISDVIAIKIEGHDCWRLIRLIDRSAAVVPELSDAEVQQKLTQRLQRLIDEYRRVEALKVLFRGSYVWPPQFAQH